MQNPDPDPNPTSSQRHGPGYVSDGDALRETCLQIEEDFDEDEQHVSSSESRHSKPETRFLLRQHHSSSSSSSSSSHNDSDADWEEEENNDHINNNGDRLRWSPRWLRTTFFRLASLARNVRRQSNNPELLPTTTLLSSSRISPSKNNKNKFRWIRVLAFLLLFFFSMIGVIESIFLLYGIGISFFSEDFVGTWGESNGLARWPTDATRDILPVACHSHNDYWRPVPLFSAINAGCISVEADVWLIDDELYVAHSRSAVAPNRTLHSLYVNPLVDLLDKQNPITEFHPAKDRPRQGVFDTDPGQTLVLLIDFKTDGPETLPYVLSSLSPLRDRGYLTHWNGVDVVEGPVTVVATGNAPFDFLTESSTYRDIFFDAPLDMIEDGEPMPLLRGRSAAQDQGQGHSGTPNAVGPNTYNPSNSYYASASFKKSIGYPWHFHITADQLRRIRAQINGAHRRGLKVRYWGTPSWPRNLRNYIWSVLEREGVDILNVDDLKGATSEDWRGRVSDWWF